MSLLLGTGHIEGACGEQRDQLKDKIANECYFLGKNKDITLAMQGQPQFKGKSSAVQL